MMGRLDKDYEETEQCKRRDNDKSGWVMCAITKTVQQLMEKFQQNRRSMTNWPNRDCRTQLTKFLKQVNSTGHPIWVVQLSFIPSEFRKLWHLHWHHLPNFLIMFILYLDYHECCNGPSNQELVIVGTVLWSWSRKGAYQGFTQPQSPIRPRGWMANIFNLYALTHIDSLLLITIYSSDWKEDMGTAPESAEA